MLINRRTFVAGTGSIAAVSFAGVLKPLAAAAASQSSAPEDTPALDVPALGITGWTHPGATSEETDDWVWISINRSWQTAWR